MVVGKSDRPQFLVGFTVLRTNLPGGRRANVITERARLVRADGSDDRPIAEELTCEPDHWTQFAGWSPDARTAYVYSGWESAENAAWEEEHKGFRMTEGWLLDLCAVDLTTGQITDLSAVERVSNYNQGCSFWPDRPSQMGFEALIDGQSHPFTMDRNGRNKRDLAAGSSSFIYGTSISPDGRQIAYHRDYRLCVAEADGANARVIETGRPFNFGPTWSPDGGWLLFVSGASNHTTDVFIVRPDGSGLRKIGDRGGYEGVIAFLDVPDFHGGSSDVPIWSKDGAWVYYTARLGKAIELTRVSLDGESQQLTHSEDGVLNYHPKVSSDGCWLILGSTRTGVRQLFIARSDGSDSRALTDVPTGWGAIHACCQPARSASANTPWPRQARC